MFNHRFQLLLIITVSSDSCLKLQVSLIRIIDALFIFGIKNTLFRTTFSFLVRNTTYAF